MRPFVSKYFTLLVLGCILLFACKKSNKKNNSIISEKYGTTIDLIDSLKYYSLEKGCISKPLLHELKIITYINAGCKDCVYELLSWKTIMNELRNKKISFLFYINPSNVNLLSSILTDIDFPYPIIMDYENSFYKKNKLDHNKMYQTFLVDRNNKIILIGNPLYGNKIKELYISTIK